MPLKNVCSMENTGRMKPRRSIAICIHLSGYLTKAIQHISLPWAPLRGFRVDTDKQRDWRSKKWPLFFIWISSPSACIKCYNCRIKQTMQQHKGSLFFIFIPFKERFVVLKYSRSCCLTWWGRKSHCASDVITLCSDSPCNLSKNSPKCPTALKLNSSLCKPLHFRLTIKKPFN